MVTYARINKKVLDGKGAMEDAALGWKKADEARTPAAEAAAAAAAEKPVFEGTWGEGEKLKVLEKEDASEFWLRDKYKGMKFVDEDAKIDGIPEHRIIFELKWVKRIELFEQLF